jgi:hypothetical protein
MGTAKFRWLWLRGSLNGAEESKRDDYVSDLPTLGSEGRR